MESYYYPKRLLIEFTGFTFPGKGEMISSANPSGILTATVFGVLVRRIWGRRGYSSSTGEFNRTLALKKGFELPIPIATTHGLRLRVSDSCVTDEST